MVAFAVWMSAERNPWAAGTAMTLVQRGQLPPPEPGPRLAGPLARAVLALPEDEREASRRAIVDNMERLRNEDGSYTAPAATWGVLVR